VQVVGGVGGVEVEDEEVVGEEGGEVIDTGIFDFIAKAEKNGNRLFGHVGIHFLHTNQKHLHSSDSFSLERLSMRAFYPSQRNSISVNEKKNTLQIQAPEPGVTLFLKPQTSSSWQLVLSELHNYFLSPESNAISCN
jgi:hypothetical protein